MSYNYLPLDRKETSFQQIRNLLAFGQLVSITFDAHERILKCREYLDNKVKDSGSMFYGINTGFGNMYNKRIEGENLEKLQDNLLRSHACGMGDYVPVEVVKLMMMLKIKSLSYGHSGVQIATVIRLMDMYNNEVYPVVYTQGSLGASGDLAPLSHLCLPLFGEGEVWYKGEKKPSKEVLDIFSWPVIHLQSKEGLALINGTQFMNAYGFSNLLKSWHLFDWATAIAAISLEAYDGNTDAFYPGLHNLRPQPGQGIVAKEILSYLEGSEIALKQKEHVQDPYSFRCIPQVHGATYDTLKYVESVFVTEMNSVTDNPIIFPDEDRIISGGNFHGQPLAIAHDLMSIAMSELASISERRTYQLIGGLRGLPILLTPESGLNSGFMIPQYTAAGIVSENKQLCTPASVDSIPSSNNQEDHVSMGANAAVKGKRVVDNVEKVLAIELLTACQAIEFRKPLKTSPQLQSVISAFREQVTFNNSDRFMHADMMKAVDFIRNNKPNT